MKLLSRLHEQVSFSLRSAADSQRQIASMSARAAPKPPVYQGAATLSPGRPAYSGSRQNRLLHCGNAAERIVKGATLAESQKAAPLT